MLPLSLTAKAIQLCAAGLGSAVNPASAAYAITVHTGATLTLVAMEEAIALAGTDPAAWLPHFYANQRRS